MSKATYNLVRSDIKLVCDLLKNLKFFDEYVSNIGNSVNSSKCTITGLKSHNSHVLMQRVLSVVLLDTHGPLVCSHCVKTMECSHCINLNRSV